MKNIRYILLFLTAMLLTSCEEVVDVDLDTAAPRLVVEASIDWVKGTAGNRQIIKLTTTTGYYSTEIPKVSGATVFITNSSNTVFDFIEQEAGTGEYKCEYFAPVLGETYVLTVINGDQTYTATETMTAVPDITYTTQANDGGFLGEDVEIRYYWNDFPDQSNYYLSRFDAAVIPTPEYDVGSDEFFEGNEMFEFFSDEDLKPGDTISIKLYGISERYHDYMNILLAAAGGGGNPFQSVPTAATGNLINQTNESNYALGYFRVCEVSALQVTVQ
ncbi:DUF4249 domain-containing protein [Flavobacterium subsaxonicum]|uniref:DUF4249 domain-containing protein n=1 Tax=Flavobacterium subsaxonicum WB 4.1-42 = DSM 21790 TaxID=1121898 RepID=A0A0A2MUL6_9FLAO|nr:DUF4249 domain-containing protein [Flavobacterium subsaxonicum]KGO91915.1 hypothetical protein Q766_14825 [Flavobacterium subsaxonicum WB 4.1-42 = DSM 21790]